ncbi:MAG: lipoyl(octanoyl) transferase LipB [Balneolaceae bacterium]
MKKCIEIYDLGNTPYQSAWDLQKTIQEQLKVQKKKLREENGSEKHLNDVLLFVEHPHVYTLGKSGNAAHLLKGLSELSEMDAEYIEIDRGGDITYHGPGQIVGYPIMDLDRYFTDIHKYLRHLEEIIIRTCADFDIVASRIDGLTGVWVGNEKICAMGIRCSRWVTMHGFAMNVNTDLSYFDHIVPCGINNKAVTSLSKISGKKVDENEVKLRIVKHFADLFGVTVKQVPKPERKQQISYI